LISSDKVNQAQYLISIAHNEEEKTQKAAIFHAIRLLYPYFPRPGQTDALHHLIYRKKDLILIAKTSFGKSMIPQAVSMLVKKSITIVILPLDQIGKEQEQYIEQMAGKPYFLNANSINNSILQKIADAQYTHILMSPELAVSKRLLPVLETPKFKEQLCLVVIDEAHLVAHWGVKFRLDYSRLNLLRIVVGQQTQWYACSATLDPSTLDAMIKGVGFDTNVTIQRTSIDRPELLLRLGIIPKKSGKAFTALRFVFDPDPLSTNLARVKPTDIPKTIIFFDSKDDIQKAHGVLMAYLQSHPKYQYTKKEASDVVRVFTRDTHDEDKDALIAEFQKPSDSSIIRVVLATEALGIGVNKLSDVRRAINYGIPKGGIHPFFGSEVDGPAEMEKPAKSSFLFNNGR
ncbi:hypothetical protein Egran_06011, partial [Elaphomyces granulatus]